MDVIANNRSLHEKCEGCGNIAELVNPFGQPVLEGAIIKERVCNVLLSPRSQWTRIQGCHMRTHSKKVMAEGAGVKPFVDPLKASRQAMKSRLKASKAGINKADKKKERRDSR